MELARSGETQPSWGPGIVEVRQVTSRVYGIRVGRHLISKIKRIQGLSQANPRSDLFCLEMGPSGLSTEAAVKRFKELAAQAGLAAYFAGEAPR